MAKAVVAAVFSAVYTAVLVVAAVHRGPADRRPAALARGCRWRSPACGGSPGALALFAALAAVLGVAVGALLRHAAGAVAVLLLWPLVVEPILGNLPNIGTEVGPYLPFGNAFVFADVQWLFPDVLDAVGPVRLAASTSPRSSPSSFVAATVVVNRRDA